MTSFTKPEFDEFVCDLVPVDPNDTEYTAFIEQKKKERDDGILNKKHDSLDSCLLGTAFSSENSIDAIGSGSLFNLARQNNQSASSSSAGRFRESVGSLLNLLKASK